MNGAAGKVYLVGAGPGDPGLLTLRGRECLERAEAVIYDHLANPALLEHARGAEKVFVGKSPARHTLLQNEINRILIDYARRYSRVVRLKGGDPFVFGRGAEEALALAEAGIAFEVVPGVTAGVAVPAYAGIPVTHRGLASACVFITAHQDPRDPESPVDLGRLAQQATLAFFMGARNAGGVAAELIRLGRSPETPVAIIMWGGYPKQRTIVTTLEQLAAAGAYEAIEAPAMVVIGEVVKLHERISWFESRPLFGKRIVVTRAREQAGGLLGGLRDLGADVFEFPTIEIQRVESPEPLEYPGYYHWVVFTSVNGVEMLFERMEELQFDARDLHGVKLCVIGSATAEAVRRRFLRIDLMPEKYVAEDLLAALCEKEGDLRGKRFLLPRADIARSFLPKELRARGAEVTELVTYRTVAPETSDDLAEALVAYGPDLITFSSSSTARNFHAMMGPERLARLGPQVAFASIGPITAATAAELGMPVSVQPEQHDIPGLVAAIAAWAQAERNRR